MELLINMNEKLINQAVNFLKNPTVRNSDKEKQVAFLKKKGLNDQEVEEAYKRLEAQPAAASTPVISGSIVSRNTMNLSRKDLTSLTDLNRMSTLKVLVLSHNKLTSLPKEIGSLVDLEILQAGHNAINNQGLPEEFFDLFQLKHLNLEHNQISTLDHFSKLRGLEKLNVAHNQIKAIPDDFVYLQSLEFIWIQDNQLSKITKQLRMMSCLRQIVLVNNPALPASVKEAYGLKELIQVLSK